MADKNDFSARIARIEERARKGGKAEFAIMPEEIERRDRARSGRGGPAGPRRTGIKVLLSLAVLAGGLALFAHTADGLDPENSFVAALMDRTDGMTTYMVDQAKTYMSAEQIDYMENDPGLNKELKRLGLENNGMARLILSN